MNKKEFNILKECLKNNEKDELIKDMELPMQQLEEPKVTTHKKMREVIYSKVLKAKHDYYYKYGREPNAILINECDLDLLNLLNLNLTTYEEKTKYEVYGLKVIPIKYGEIQVVEVLK